MNIDARIILEERISQAEYPMDFCAIAVEILGHGDPTWAESVYLRAVKRARSLDDKTWVLVDGLDNGLCPPTVRDELLKFMDTRSRIWDRLLAIDTFIQIGDHDRASAYLLKWAERARSIEFLTEAAKKAWDRELATSDVIDGWLRRGEALCRTDDDWYLVAKGWARLGRGEDAARAADVYDDLSSDLDDLLTTIELLRDIAPDHAAKRCRRILDEGNDAFLLACVIKECVTVAPDIVPKVLFKFLNQNGDCHDCLMVLHAVGNHVTPEMCKTLVKRAIRRADDAYDAADILKAAVGIGCTDIAAAILDNFFKSDTDLNGRLALLNGATESGDSALLRHVRTCIHTVVDQISNIEQLVDCVHILRALRDEEAVQELLMGAEFYIRGCWDWIHLLSVLDPRGSAVDSEAARRWVSRAALTSLEPDALSSLAGYVRRHLQDASWADHLESTPAICRRGTHALRRLVTALANWADVGVLDGDDAPKWPVETGWDFGLRGAFDPNSEAHHFAFINQITRDEETLSAALDWACKESLFKLEDEIRIISEVRRTAGQLRAIRYELEQMAVDVRDMPSANGSWNTQLFAACKRRQVDETIPVFVQRLSSVRERMWVGD